MMKFIKIYKDCILNKKGEVHQPNPQKNGVKSFFLQNHLIKA